MRRRDFVVILGGAAVAWPLAARAQKPSGKMPDIGVLGESTSSAQNQRTAAFRLDRGSPMTKRQQRFSNSVRAVVKKIPKGRTMTYKQVATKAGNPKAARAVGMIMSHNFDSKIPCHRVVRGDGKKRLQSRRLGT